MAPPPHTPKLPARAAGVTSGRTPSAHPLPPRATPRSLRTAGSVGHGSPNPLVGLALEGFAWADVCTRLSAQAAALVAEMHPEGCAYYPHGRPIAAGSIVRLPGLADVLREWVDLGADLLDGPVGDAIVREVAARGGALRADDFAAAAAEWIDCASVDLVAPADSDDDGGTASLGDTGSRPTGPACSPRSPTTMPVATRRWPGCTARS